MTFSLVATADMKDCRHSAITGGAANMFVPHVLRDVNCRGVKANSLRQTSGTAICLKG